MTRDRLLAELREVLDDTGVDPGWSDMMLLGYLAEGQDKFCEDTGLFVDATSYTVTTVDGTASYSLSARIIEVLEVYYGTQRLGKYQQEDRGYHLPPGMPQEFTTSTMQPYAWQADYATGSITFYPTPNGAKTYTLRVWRYPLYELDGDDANGDPATVELPSRLARACVEWAAYKALMHHDMEKQDPVKADDHLRAYRQYVSDGKAYLRRRQGAEVRIGGNPLYVV